MTDQLIVSRMAELIQQANADMEWMSEVADELIRVSPGQSVEDAQIGVGALAAMSFELGDLQLEFFELAQESGREPDVYKEAIDLAISQSTQVEPKA
jgi:hypothetical protein